MPLQIRNEQLVKLLKSDFIDHDSGLHVILLTGKGALVSASAQDTPATLPVGTDGYVLTAASGEATGLQWATIGPGGVPVDHAGLTNKGWTSSGHTGSNNAIAAFDGGGAVTELFIGTDIQAWDADLDTLAGLAKTDSNFIVGNGSAWVVESGATVRTSLGLGTADSPTFAGATINGNITVTGTVDGEDISTFKLNDASTLARLARMEGGGNKLKTATAATDTSIDVYAVPSDIPNDDGRYAIIEPTSASAEFREITGVSGTALSVNSQIDNVHAIGSIVRVTRQPVVNARDFYTGSGSFHTALTNALTQAQKIGDGVGVYIPGSDTPYDFSSGVDFASGTGKNITIFGDGFATTLRATAAVSILTVQGGGNYSAMEIHHLRFDTNGYDATAIAMERGGQSGIIRDVWVEGDSAVTGGLIELGESVVPYTATVFKLERLKLKGGAASFPAAGIRFIENFYNITIDDCDLLYCTNLIDNLTTGNGASVVNITNCRLDECDKAIDFDAIALWQLNISGNRFENPATYAIDLYGFDATTNFMFMANIADNYFSGIDTGVTAIRAGRIKNLNISGNLFVTSSGATPMPQGNGLELRSVVTEVRLWGNGTMDNRRVDSAITGYTAGLVLYDMFANQVGRIQRMGSEVFQLRELAQRPMTYHSGTAQAGAATTITLASNASSSDDAYNSRSVRITGGTGSGQTKVITDYVGSTKVATVNTAWSTNPDATSTYEVFMQYEDGMIAYDDGTDWSGVGAESVVARVNGAWVGLAASFSDFLPLAGGNLTGNVTLDTNITIDGEDISDIKGNDTNAPTRLDRIESSPNELDGAIVATATSLVTIGYIPTWARYLALDAGNSNCEIVGPISGAGTRAASWTGGITNGHSDGAVVLPLADAIWNVLYFGAVADGSTNDAAAINAAFADVGNKGRAMVYFPPGQYAVNSVLTLSATNVTVYGNKARILFGSGISGSPGLTISGDNCTIDSMSFNGYDPGSNVSDNNRTILATGSNVHLINLRITDAKIPIDFRSTTGGGAFNCKVTHSTIKSGVATNNYYQGIRASAADGLDIVGCEVSGYGENINITSYSGTQSTSVRILGGILRDADDHAVYISLGDNISIIGTQVEDFDSSGIKCHGDHILVESCRVSGDGENGISLQGEGTADGDGYSAYDQTVTGNIIVGDMNGGIVVRCDPASPYGNIKNPQISNNIIRFTGSSTNYGIYFYANTSEPSQSVGAKIAGNHIIGSVRGIFVDAGAGEYHDYMTIANNYIEEATRYGIWTTNLRYSNIHHNHCINTDTGAGSSTDAGIRLTGCTYNLIEANFLGDNQGTATQAYGIYSESGSDYNVFRDNETEGAGTRTISPVGSHEQVFNRKIQYRSISASDTFELGEAGEYHITQTTGPAKNFNPLGTMVEGYEITVSNMSASSGNLTFDSATLAATITPGQIGRFKYINGAWKQLWLV